MWLLGLLLLLIVVYALRDIKFGEEITMDYRRRRGVTPRQGVLYIYLGGRCLMLMKRRNTKILDTLECKVTILIDKNIELTRMLQVFMSSGSPRHLFTKSSFNKFYGNAAKQIHTSH
jgi:hypothetical protein